MSVGLLMAAGNGQIPAGEDTLQFDPETGMPVHSTSEVEKPIPAPTREPSSPRTFTEDDLRDFIMVEIDKSGLLKRLLSERAAASMALTDERVIQMAKSDARKNHNGTNWAAGGGVVSCGSAVLGAVLGAVILEFPGFLIGTGLGLFGTPVLVAHVSTMSSGSSQNSIATTPDKMELYRQSYAAETRKLRLSSIYRGEVGLAAIVAGGILVLIMVGSS